MDDDFNTGGAVGKLYELVTFLNKSADSNSDFGNSESRNSQAFVSFKRGVNVLRELSQILGLFWAPIETAKGGDDTLVNGLMQLLIDLRAEARKAKNFALGDQIRKRLTELGVTLEDRAGGTNWRKE
jgi:cysteinyl-tRNA synthetase